MNIHSLVFSLWYLRYWCLWQQDIFRICVAFLRKIIRQTCLGRYIIWLFDNNRPTWIQAVNSHCRTSIFEDEFKFKCVSEEIYIHISIQNIVLTFVSGTLPGNINMKVSPNIWNWSTFQTTSLYALQVHRQFQRENLYT